MPSCFKNVDVPCLLLLLTLFFSWNLAFGNDLAMGINPGSVRAVSITTRCYKIPFTAEELTTMRSGERRNQQLFEITKDEDLSKIIGAARVEIGDESSNLCLDFDDTIEERGDQQEEPAQDPSETDFA